MTTRGALLQKGPNLGSYFVLPILGHAVRPPPLLSEALQLQHAPGAAAGLEMGMFKNWQRHRNSVKTRGGFTFSKMEYLATWKWSGNGGRSESSPL